MDFTSYASEVSNDAYFSNVDFSFDVCTKHLVHLYGSLPKPQFANRLTELHFLDPQCGHSNLLIAAFLSVKRLLELLPGGYVPDPSHFHGLDISQEYVDASIERSTKYFGSPFHLSTCTLDTDYSSFVGAPADDVFLFMNPPFNLSGNKKRDSLGNLVTSSVIDDLLKLRPQCPSSKLDLCFLYHALSFGFSQGICYCQYTHMNDTFYQSMLKLGVGLDDPSEDIHNGSDVHANSIQTAVLLMEPFRKPTLKQLELDFSC